MLTLMVSVGLTGRLRLTAAAVQQSAVHVELYDPCIAMKLGPKW